MGVYYYFLNENGERNNYPIDDNYPTIIWCAKLDTFKRDEILKLFKKIINKNKWTTEKIFAYADDNLNAIEYNQFTHKLRHFYQAMNDNYDEDRVEIFE